MTPAMPRRRRPEPPQRTLPDQQRRPRDRLARWAEFVEAWDRAVQAIHNAMDSVWRPGRCDPYAVLTSASRTHQGRCLVERVMFGHGVPPYFWWRPPWYEPDATPPVWDATPKGYAPATNPLDRVYGWELDASGRLVRRPPPSQRS